MSMEDKRQTVMKGDICKIRLDGAKCSKVNIPEGLPARYQEATSNEVVKEDLLR